MFISYDSAQLIADVQEDIGLFGNNYPVYAVYKNDYPQIIDSYVDADPPTKDSFISQDEFEELMTDFKAVEIIEDDRDESTIIGANHSNAVTAIELFAGAGGLALGLEQAGIDTIEYVEIDKYCCKTLRRNRPHWNVVNADISKVDFTKYRGLVDIVTGGFPCQAFSYAGKKLGFDDTRGTLFHEFARCVKEVSPIIFLAENVKGLLSHDKGRTFNTIIEVLGELGYSIQYKVLNAAYYGVGQKRERIIIIGTKNGINFDFPKPEKNMTTLKTSLKNCPISEGQSYSDRKKMVLEHVPPGGCWIDLPKDMQADFMGKSLFSGGGKRGMARRISWDEPCLTLTCSPSQKQTERCHPDETRPFTVREYARIQSFPDDWEFCGGIGQKYKQIGNAVPVEMARRIGINLKSSVNEYKKTQDA
jgi:DNA (cytosine-5)-methyltransferase 1